MRALLISIAASVLAGCAVSPERAQNLAANAPEWELCYVAVTGKGQPSVRQAVNNEIQRRNVNCNQYANLIAAKIQADNAQMQMGLDMMRAARPQPVTPSSTTTCRSFNRGTYIQTVCD